MHELLRDLYGHQAWADAEMWRSCAAHPPALADRVLGDRLRHILIVQRAFLAVVRRRRIDHDKLSEEPDLLALAQGSRAYHEQARAFVASADAEQLNQTVAIPWFQGLTLTIEQALVQATLHTQHHRGQNATRLRDLGGEPPTVDLIVWWWKGRPEPSWEAPPLPGGS